MINGTKPIIEFFVKPSPVDKKTKGPGMVEQQWLMTLSALQEKGLIDFEVIPVTFERLPESYRELSAGRLLPVARIKSGVIDNLDATNVEITSTDLLEALMVKLKCPNLLTADFDATKVRASEKIQEDLYKSVMNYVHNDISKSLLHQLASLDSFLAGNADPYILGHDISYIDCLLMPKLHHLRVSCRAYRQFDIPEDLLHVWAYVALMYKTQLFMDSCPPDRDILMHYEERDKLPQNIRPSLMEASVSTEIPEVVRQKLDRTNGST